MSQKNVYIIYFIILILGVLVALLLFSYNNSMKNRPIPNPDDVTMLNWNASETIRMDYDKCKNINRSLYINRLIKKDFRLTMCPKDYVVLYDKSQEIVFIFNENENQNPAILTIDTACDNSSGQC